jgi:hypothetical protein
MSRRLITALAIAALAATATTAHAADFSVSVANTKNLDPAAGVISVTVNNIPDGKGIYFQVCENTNKPGDSCDSARGASKWLSTATTSARMGATVVPATSVQTFAIPSSFTNSAGVQVRCAEKVNQCGLYVRADHLNAADESLKRFVPISFTGAKPKVNAVLGFANDRIMVRVFGATGQTLSVKIGGRWVTRVITSDNQLVALKTGSKKVAVEAYVGGVKLATR